MGVLTAFLFLGETLRGWQIVGGVIAIGGMWLAAYRRSWNRRGGRRCGSTPPPRSRPSIASSRARRSWSPGAPARSGSNSGVHYRMATLRRSVSAGTFPAIEPDRFSDDALEIDCRDETGSAPATASHHGAATLIDELFFASDEVAIHRGRRRSGAAPGRASRGVQDPRPRERGRRALAASKSESAARRPCAGWRLGRRASRALQLS